MATFTFDDLLIWSEKLPGWQRDALRRVLTNGLTETDISELALMAKVAQGASIPGTPPPVAAAKSHVRSPGASADPVALRAVRDITYVNALASGPITFAPEGLTVVYGDNASGKSGITRILKKTGRASSPGGRIRPSVFDADPAQPASATIEFRLGTTDRSFPWVDGALTDDELTRINVFDASCAVVQVEESNHLAYTPEILRTFQDLAEACHAVGARIKIEKEALENARPAQIGLVALRSDTSAGHLSANLSQHTKPGEIDILCDVTEAERDRFGILTRALQDNPTRQADLFEARARRLKGLDELMANLENALDDTAAQAFESKISEAAATAEAARAASQVFATNSALVGFGTAAWKQLWESARRYSETLAYPTEPFPVAREDALCVLCQQPLGGATSQRFSTFEQFVKDEVQQRAEAAHREIQTRTLHLKTIRIPVSAVLLRETALTGTSVSQDTKSFIVIARLRRRYLLRKAADRNPTRPRNLPPRPDLTASRASLSEEIRLLRAAAQNSERRKMQSELAELEDRLKLSTLKDILHGEVERLTTLNLLDRARNSCDTTGITRKGGEVARLVVTTRLRSGFASNLSQLGFSAAPVEVTLGYGTVGHHPYHLSLIAPENVPLSEVLSEGEKTCVALAGFLAELETTNNRSGIVLDDPVSSLDHHYRLRVAQRLIKAAKDRQVIVFTHDIVFLLMLTRYARKEGVKLRESSLLRGGPRHGVPEEGPPWVAMTVGKRLGVLRKELQTAAALLNKGDRTAYEQKTEWIYKRLRQTWERAVEEVLLNEVIVRFGDGVSTQRLKLLTDITVEDIQCVDSQMTYCSSFVHDETGAVNAGIPEPLVLEADIKRLENWVETIRKRRK